MAGRKEDIDLELALKNPKHARRYIAQFDWGLPDPPKYMVYGVDDKIWFDRMTDEEAVRTALTILEDVDRKMSFRTKEMMIDLEVH